MNYILLLIDTWQKITDNKHLPYRHVTIKEHVNWEADTGGNPT